MGQHGKDKDGWVGSLGMGYIDIIKMEEGREGEGNLGNIG
jgi:hypothetical protein